MLPKTETDALAAEILVLGTQVALTLPEVKPTCDPHPPRRQPLPRSLDRTCLHRARAQSALRPLWHLSVETSLWTMVQRRSGPRSATLLVLQHDEDPASSGGGTSATPSGRAGLAWSLVSQTHIKGTEPLFSEPGEPQTKLEKAAAKASDNVSTAGLLAAPAIASSPLSAISCWAAHSAPPSPPLLPCLQVSALRHSLPCVRVNLVRSRDWYRCC